MIVAVVQRFPWPARTRALVRAMEEQLGPFPIALVAPSGGTAWAKRVAKKRSIVRTADALAGAALYRRYTKAIARAQNEAFGHVPVEWRPSGPVEDVGDLSTPAARAWLDRHAPQAVVPIDGGIVSPEMLAKCPWIRWHHAIMPDLRGAASPFWAIAEGRPEWLGATVQRLVEKLDAGEVLAQARLVPERDDNLVTVHVKLDRLVIDLLLSTLRGLAGIDAGPVVPPEVRFAAEHRRGTYLSMPGLADVLRFPLTERAFFRRYGRGGSVERPSPTA